MNKKFKYLLFIALGYSASTFGQIVMPKIFNDNMVLQRDQPLKIWGSASKGESVQVSFHGHSIKTTANNEGKWAVTFKAMPYGGPFQMKIKGKTNSIEFKNILLGDIWICGGQSNMEFPISGWTNVKNYKEEIASANHPNIRLFTVEKDIRTTPTAEIKDGKWEQCSPATISPFSAVGYFFGRDLYNKLHVPIGLINSNWGGTDIETWISRSSLDTSKEYKNAVSSLPQLSLDSLRAIQQSELLNTVKKLQGGLPKKADIAQWRNPQFNNKQWPTMQLPGVWEDQQLGKNFDGQVWFRKEITIDAISNKDTATLSLCMIDDNDETYINGVKIGSTEGYNVMRSYKIKPGILHTGKNTIVIHVTDGGGNGGVYGSSKDLNLNFNNTTINLSGPWTFQVAAINLGGGSFGPNSYPSLLYNAMINPLIKFKIKGVIWYQGENNAIRGYQYRKAMPLLIKDWRNHWKEGNFPFYFVQISTYNANNGNSNKGSTWAELRESQTKTLSKVPNVGMAVTTDIGDPNNIHPTNKQDVGKRLTALALKNTYHFNITASGPMYKSMQVHGNKIILSFSDMGHGLYIKGSTLNGFEIAGKDRHFYPAQATLTGQNVMVHSDKVNSPVAVRYGWADDASAANLYNKDLFPAVPFRTDTWPAITKDIKYHIAL